MACSSCKKKNETVRNEIEDQFSGLNKTVIIFVIAWSLLAMLGIYTLVNLFI